MGLIAEFFLLSLGLGVAAWSPLARTEQTGVGLLKLMNSVVGVSLLLGMGAHFYNAGLVYDPKLINYALGILFSVLTYVWHKDKRTYAMNLLHIFQLLALFKLLPLYADGFGTFAYQLSSILFLGIVTYSMLLGHWYLVVPKLSEKPLALAVNFIWFFLAVKFAHTIWEAGANPAFRQDMDIYNPDYSFNWLMLAMRIGWGYLVIGIMNYYSMRLVRMRSIQSATGILYVMTFFVFVGEVIACYMFYKMGVRL